MFEDHDEMHNLTRQKILDESDFIFCVYKVVVGRAYWYTPEQNEDSQ